MSRICTIYVSVTLDYLPFSETTSFSHSHVVAINHDREPPILTFFSMQKSNSSFKDRLKCSHSCEFLYQLLEGKTRSSPHLFVIVTASKFNFTFIIVSCTYNWFFLVFFFFSSQYNLSSFKAHITSVFLLLLEAFATGRDWQMYCELHQTGMNADPHILHTEHSLAYTALQWSLLASVYLYI